jgi:hypothetical protein
MRAIFVALVVALTTSAVPLAGQERLDPSEGLIHRAMASEAVRLAAAPADLAPVQQGGNSAEAGWSRIRQRAPRTELNVTVKGAPPAKRHFVAADDSQLTVSNGAGQVEHIERTDVVEVRVLAKHIGRHARRGVLVGGIGGAVMMGLVLAETGCPSPFECFAYEGAGTAAGAGYGALIGAIVGSVEPRSLDVVYRAP